VHRGVLFLDEAPEFAGGVLDALRQSLESGVVEVDRASARASYPARFQLVMAANPCPCGSVADLLCSCRPSARHRYLGRLSGPLLDRIDLQVRLRRLSRADLLGLEQPESSAVVAARVASARARAARRLRGTPWTTNAELSGPQIRAHAPLTREALGPATEALGRGRLTARGVAAVSRVAWTLTDLDGRRHPGAGDVSEALGMRGLS